MADPETPREDVFEVDRIRNLLNLMQEFDLREIDLRQTDQRIRLCRGIEPAVIATAPPVAAAPAKATPVAPAEPATPAAPPRAEPENPNIAYIKSPMVGTFYSRPNPKAEPYVRPGDNVSPESVVCIIEAMKVFNEIPAEVRGRIVAILVDDEEPIEFGKPLFKIDTGA